MRRTHFKLNVTGLTTCNNCAALIPAHTVCPQCGFYRGEDVLKLEGEKKVVAPSKRRARKQVKAAEENKDTKKAAEKTTKVKKTAPTTNVTKKQKVVSE
jgi:large subunit ribosomal protein L32